MVLKVINVTRRLINARAIHVPKMLLCALIQSLGPIVFVQLVNFIVKISTRVVLMICVTKSDHVKTTESVFHHRVVTSANVPLDGRARIVPSGLIPVMVRISRLELCSKHHSQMVRIRVKMEAIVYLLIMSTISSVSVDLRTTRVNIVSCSMIDPLMSALAMILPLAKMSQMIKPVKRSRLVLDALSSTSLFELQNFTFFLVRQCGLL